MHVAILLFCVCSTYAQYVTVNTPSGTIRGLNQGSYNVFKGIPYANTPTRWLHAEPKSKWNDTLDATKFGDACMQYWNSPRHGNMSEDCLFLNVWTPRNISALAPVVIFIHGGGWRQGHSDDPIYWGDFLANSTDTILVTLNYRLGIFGFIAFPPFFDTNVGITDQQIALEWVHTHIRSFGGDPTKITLAGQSAGAISVTIHMTSDKMIQKPLFNKAILHSNPMLLDFRTIEQSIPYTLEFASIIGCASGYRQAIVECILSKDAQDVLDAQEQVIWIPFPLSLKDDIPWQPVIDNDIIFEQPHQLIAKGHIMPNVSVIIGMVQNESTSFVYGPKPTPLDPLLYVGMLTAWFGQETTGKILKYYPSQLDSRNSLSQLVTDYFWTCSIRKAAQSLSQRVPTYLFVFEYSPIADPLNNTTYCKHGRSCHGADLTYVFHSAKLAGYDFNSVQEEKLSRLMLGIWTNFAKDAKPWDLYDKSKEELAVFTEHGMDTKHKYHVDQCNLWDIIGEKSYNSVL